MCSLFFLRKKYGKVIWYVHGINNDQLLFMIYRHSVPKEYLVADKRKGMKAKPIYAAYTKSQAVRHITKLLLGAKGL